MAAPVIQFKRGLFSNLPGLRAGEPGFTTDKYDLYVGIDSTTNGNKFFGSHRYWTKETTTAGSGVNLVEGTNNGSNSITLKAPASIGSDVTYTFPGAAVDQGYLRTNSSGTLTWESGVNATGVSTISFLQATTANVSAAATVGTDLSVNRNLTVSGGITGNVNASGVSTAAFLQATTANVSAAATVGTDLSVNRDLTVSGGITGNLNASGVSTAAFLRATTVNVSAAATVGTDLSVNRDLTVSGGITGRINSVGVSTITQLQATTVNATGIITASSFRGADFRDTDGSLVPLVGVQTGGGHNGLVTAFKFVGTGLENYSVVNEVATITIAGVAASTYTTSELVTATASQAAFTVSAGYQEGFVDVYLNGLRLVTGVDYTATDGSLVNLTTGATQGDELEFVTYKSLGDVVAVQNFRTAGNIVMTGFATATSTFRANGGSVLSGVTTAVQLLATTANVSAAATVGTDLSVNRNLTVSGGIAGNINASGVSTAAYLQATTANVSAAATVGTDLSVNRDLTVSGGITGRINSVGVSTITQLQATTVNAVGVITASQFNGSGAGISSNTIPILALDIAGGTALSSLTQNDLLVVADEGTGNIRKITAEQMSQYVLGGAGGATLPALKVTGLSTFVGNATAEANLTVSGGITGKINSVGVSTISFLQATTANISAGATVGGALDVNGGADISGGETTLSSATVSDLTSGRVVLAGTAGALQDSANLTFGNNGLVVGAGGANITGISTFSSNVTISGDLIVNGTTTSINTIQTTVEDTLLELQMIDGSAPSSDTNKDVGLIMNYYDTQARKAAFFWDDSATRFVLAATASETTGVVTPATYGGLEIGSLYLNDCAGASQVISCSGTTRSLENITIDGGSF
jgi:hypothetical protein